DRGLDGELLAVGAQGPERRRVAHAAAGDAGTPEAIDLDAVRGAEALRQEPVEGAAERFLARAAEDLLGGAVEEDDVLARIHRDDGVHRRVDDGGELRLRRLGAMLGHEHLARGHQDAHADHDHVGDEHAAEEPGRVEPAHERGHVQGDDRRERRAAQGERNGVPDEAAFDGSQTVQAAGRHSDADGTCTARSGHGGAPAAACGAKAPALGMELPASLPLPLALLAFGLVSGVHCAGMCGGIVAAFSTQGREQPLLDMRALARRQLAFNAGRITSYAAAGVAAGALGSAGAYAAAALGAQSALAFAANGLLVLMGLYLLGASRLLAPLERLGTPLWRR